ncbi:MAG: IS66 family transposase [Ktedonobacterales bacterium]
MLHSDETGVRQAGHLALVHVASTKQLTHYAVHPKRGSEATSAIGILPCYQGVSVHDGWKPYQTHTSCRHALFAPRHAVTVSPLQGERTRREVLESPSLPGVERQREP